MLSVRAVVGGAWATVEAGRSCVGVVMGGLGKAPCLRRMWFPLEVVVPSSDGDTDDVFAAVLELM